MASMMAVNVSAEPVALAEVPAPAPRLSVVPELAGSTSATEPDESEFRSFGLAIVLGILVGIPVLGALVAAGVWWAAPETEPMAVLGIALWVSLFCGPFLAGTVTVGLWSSRQH